MRQHGLSTPGSRHLSFDVSRDAARRGRACLDPCLIIPRASVILTPPAGGGARRRTTCTLVHAWYLCSTRVAPPDARDLITQIDGDLLVRPLPLLLSLKR